MSNEQHAKVDLTKAEIQMAIEALNKHKPSPEDMGSIMVRIMEISTPFPFMADEERESKLLNLRREVEEKFQRVEDLRSLLIAKLVLLRNGLGKEAVS